MKKIIQGIKNHMLEKELELAERRMDICNKCEYKKDDGIFGDKCALCGCVLKFKTKSPASSCPDGRW